MNQRILGKTGLKVSPVSLGCWNLGNQWGSISDGDAQSIVSTALDCGINLFDVADNYGQPNGTSEIRLGQALRGIRDKVCIVSKIGHWGERSGQALPYTTPDIIRLCGHASLGRLQTSYIDIELCHDGNIQDPSVYIEGLEHLKREGFIREYGISTDRFDVLRRFYEMSDGHCSVVELEYSLVHPYAEFNGMLEYCQEHQLGVIVRGVFGQGIVSGKYDLSTVFADSVRGLYNRGQKHRALYEKRIAILNRLQKELGMTDLTQMSLLHALHLPSEPVTIVGATSPEQVLKNVETASLPCTDVEYQKIHDILRPFAETGDSDGT